AHRVGRPGLRRSAPERPGRRTPHPAGAGPYRPAADRLGQRLLSHALHAAVLPARAVPPRGPRFDHRPYRRQDPARAVRVLGPRVLAGAGLAAAPAALADGPGP